MTYKQLIKTLRLLKDFTHMENPEVRVVKGTKQLPITGIYICYPVIEIGRPDEPYLVINYK